MLADPGLSPASGSFIAKQGAIGTGTALARSSAAADATFQQGNKYVEGLQNISRIGTKQAELAQSGMAAAAKQMTAQNQNEAQLKMQEQAADAQATGTYAAAGATVAVVAIAAIA